MPKLAPPPTDADLVVEALRARAEQRKRACTAMSAEIAGDRAAGKDVRSSAVRVVDELAAADRMHALADRLAAGDVSLVTVLERVDVAGLPAVVSEDVPPDTLLIGQESPVGDPASDPDLAGLVPDHERDLDDAEIITVDL